MFRYENVFDFICQKYEFGLVKGEGGFALCPPNKEIGDAQVGSDMPLDMKRRDVFWEIGVRHGEPNLKPPPPPPPPLRSPLYEIC